MHCPVCGTECEVVDEYMFGYKGRYLAVKHRCPSCGREWVEVEDTSDGRYWIEPYVGEEEDEGVLSEEAEKAVIEALSEAVRGEGRPLKEVEKEVVK